MRPAHKLLTLILCCTSSLLAIGCGGDETPGSSTTITQLPAGDSNCPLGGTKLVSGDQESFVCNGAGGPSGAPGPQGPSGPDGEPGPEGAAGQSATSEVLPPGSAECPLGGVEIVTASGPVSLCHGDAGETGAAGESVTAATLALGSAECPFGGSAFTSASGTTYACNGGPGAQGPSGETGPAGAEGPAGQSATTAVLPPGSAECALGGVEIVTASGTVALCNGDTSATGAAGESVTAASLALGSPECPFGGSVFTSASGTTYACNGEPGPQGVAGELGPAGPAGPEGPVGDPGPAGVCEFHLSDPAFAGPGPAPGALAAGGIERLRVNADGGLVLWGDPAGLSPASGAGTRLMFHPGKGALRAGTVDSADATSWDEANLGQDSAAFGNSTRASGANSFAAGVSCTASGDNSVALGGGATASAHGTMSFNGTASALGAIALGSGTQATGNFSLAFGPYSTAAGGTAVAIGNESSASGYGSVAIGTRNSASGAGSLALGNSADTASYGGAIVINDASGNALTATAHNQISLRGSGGVRIFTSSTLASGVTLNAGGGAWNTLSDRNAKQSFESVDTLAVLEKLMAMPITTWQYKTEKGGQRHMGPMAQDFHAAFELNDSDTTINTADIDGVALAAIQGLNAKLEAENDALRQRTADLEARLERLERLVAPR